MKKFVKGEAVYVEWNLFREKSFSIEVPDFKPGIFEGLDVNEGFCYVKFNHLPSSNQIQKGQKSAVFVFTKVEKKNVKHFKTVFKKKVKLLEEKWSNFIKTNNMKTIMAAKEEKNKKKKKKKILGNAHLLGFDGEEMHNVQNISDITKELDFIRSMEEKESNEYESITSFGKILEQCIPKIISIGGQSNGKSSVLRRLLNLSLFPVGDSKSTYYPIQIDLMNCPENFGVEKTDGKCFILHKFIELQMMKVFFGKLEKEKDFPKINLKECDDMFFVIKWTTKKLESKKEHNKNISEAIGKGSAKVIILESSKKIIKFFVQDAKLGSKTVLHNIRKYYTKEIESIWFQKTVEYESKLTKKDMKEILNKQRFLVQFHKLTSITEEIKGRKKKFIKPDFSFDKSFIITDEELFVRKIHDILKKIHDNKRFMVSVNIKEEGKKDEIRKYSLGELPNMNCAPVKITVLSKVIPFDMRIIDLPGFKRTNRITVSNSDSASSTENNWKIEDQYNFVNSQKNSMMLFIYDLSLDRHNSHQFDMLTNFQQFIPNFSPRTVAAFTKLDVYYKKAPSHFFQMKYLRRFRETWEDKFVINSFAGLINPSTNVLPGVKRGTTNLETVRKVKEKKNKETSGFKPDYNFWNFKMIDKKENEELNAFFENAENEYIHLYSVENRNDFGVLRLKEKVSEVYKKLFGIYEVLYNVGLIMLIEKVEKFKEKFLFSFKFVNKEKKEMKTFLNKETEKMKKRLKLFMSYKIDLNKGCSVEFISNDEISKKKISQLGNFEEYNKIIKKHLKNHEMKVKEQLKEENKNFDKQFEWEKEDLLKKVEGVNAAIQLYKEEVEKDIQNFKSRVNGISFKNYELDWKKANQRRSEVHIPESINNNSPKIIIKESNSLDEKIKEKRVLLNKQKEKGNIAMEKKLENKIKNWEEEINTFGEKIMNEIRSFKSSLIQDERDEILPIAKPNEEKMLKELAVKKKEWMNDLIKKKNVEIEDELKKKETELKRELVFEESEDSMKKREKEGCAILMFKETVRKLGIISGKSEKETKEETSIELMWEVLKEKKDNSKKAIKDILVRETLLLCLTNLFCSLRKVKEEIKSEKKVEDLQLKEIEEVFKKFFSNSSLKKYGGQDKMSGWMVGKLKVLCAKWKLMLKPLKDGGVVVFNSYKDNVLKFGYFKKEDFN